MKKILKLIRWYDWYDSKLPLFFFAYYYLLIIYRKVWASYLILLVPLGIFYMAFFSFGYMLNDYFDRSIDRASGKLNILGTLPDRQQKIALLTVLIIGFIAFIPFFDYKTAMFFLFVSYISAIFYSTPPFRFKEKGVAGVICASLGQRVFPLLVVYSIFEHFKFDSFFLIILSFLIGLRWILIHQLLDRDKDLMANVHTFVACTSEQKVYNLMLFLFIAELISVVAFMGIITQTVSFLLPVPIIYLAFQLYFYPLWKHIGLKRIFCSYNFAPLADFYFLWLPLSTSIILACLINPLFLTLTAMEALWKVEYLKFDVRLIKIRGTAREKGIS